MGKKKIKKMENIIAQISTHKAVSTKSGIDIIKKGFYFDEDLSFEEEILYTISKDSKDDVLAIMEDFAETNRINLAQANGEFY